jgi:type I restriction enzyme S subunit
VARVLPGFAFKSAHLGDDGTPVVKIGNITDDGAVDLSLVQRLPDSYLKPQHEKFRLSNRDIVLAMTGATAGKAGRISAPDDASFLLNQRVAKLEPLDIDPDFFWYVISTSKYRDRFYSLGGGAAQPNMSGPQIASVEIPYPPKAVQSKIANSLSAYDDLIENNRKRIALLEEAARMLYREWFVRFRFPGHEHVKVIEGMPEGWEQCPFGQIAELNYGKALKEENRVEGAFPVYGSSGIVGTHQAALVEGPTIIVGRKGNVGSIYWSPVNFWPIDTVYFIPKEQADFWLYLALPSAGLQNTDAGVPGLNRDFAHSRKLICPTPRLRRLFNEAVGPMFAQRATLENYNQKLGQARDLLLPRLMNGEIAI